MTYRETLPSTHSLKQLAEVSGPFPIKNQHLLLTAERFGFSDRLTEFLRFFPLQEVFHSRDSFLQNCADLKNTIRSERQGLRDVVTTLKGASHGYYPAGTAHQARIKSGWRNFFWSD